MNIQNSSRSLGVLTIATNIYIDYWLDMAISFNTNIKLSDNVVLHVFTDQIHKVNQAKAELKNVFVVGHEIPNYEWPQATLLRYAIIDSFAEELTEDLLMHLDADMLINQSPQEVIQQAAIGDQICLVSHPGYWRPKEFFTRTNFYKHNFRFIVNDFRMIIKLGGLGSWETDKKSSAYVPRRFRRNYVCGGTWFGEKHCFLRMVSELSRNVTSDLKQNRISIWHDESHLNFWASKNSYVLLDPKLCFVSSYPQLEGLIPVITAVEKNAKTR